MINAVCVNVSFLIIYVIKTAIKLMRYFLYVHIYAYITFNDIKRRLTPRKRTDPSQCIEGHGLRLSDSHVLVHKRINVNL